MPIVIEFLHFYKDTLKSGARFILCLLWCNLTLQSIILVFYTINIVVALVSTVNYILSNELAIYCSEQYATVGDYSPTVNNGELVNTTISLSTDNSHTSSTNISGSGSTNNASLVGGPLSDSGNDSSVSSSSDSGFGSPGDIRSSSEIERGIQRNEELEELHARSGELNNLLDALETRANGGTITEAQSALIRDSGNPTINDVVQELDQTDTRINGIYNEMGELSSNSGSDGESNNGNNS
jgi:hypothetical protein